MVQDVLNRGFGNGLARTARDWILRIVQGDSDTGLVNRWEKRSRRIRDRETNPVAV